MQYEPIKRSINRFISGSPFLRKVLYSFLDLLLLRAWHVRSALKKIAVSLPDNSQILDAGSGLGQYSWRMCRMNNTWRIKGIDIDKEQVEECKQFFFQTGKADRTEFDTGNLTTYVSDNTYNLILSVDVMEHIEEDVQVFRNFYNSLKSNGFLLISTPSDKGGSDVHSDEEESFIDEHVRDGYSITEITEKLQSAGFAEVSALYTYGKPGSFSWKLSMKYPVKMINISYFFFLLLPFYYVLALPFSLFLNCLDQNINHTSGTGLLVTARKINS